MTKKTDKDKLFERMGLVNPDRKVLNEDFNQFEDDFTPHGTYSISSGGGYEVMLNDAGDAAKVRDAFGSDNPKTSDWLEIEYVPSEDGGEDSEPVIDPNGYNIPLNQTMRIRENDGGFGIGTSPEAEPPYDDKNNDDEEMDIIYKDNEAEKNDDDFLESVRNVIKENEINEDAGSSPINKYVMFSYNYPQDFIEKIWADNEQMMNHFKGKFSSTYDRVGSKAVMNAFYTELDGGNRKKFEDWILSNYQI